MGISSIGLWQKPRWYAVFLQGAVRCFLGKIKHMYKLHVIYNIFIQNGQANADKYAILCGWGEMSNIALQVGYKLQCTLLSKTVRLIDRANDSLVNGPCASFSYAFISMPMRALMLLFLFLLLHVRVSVSVSESASMYGSVSLSVKYIDRSIFRQSSRQS